MDNLTSVEMLYAKHDLRHVLLRPVFWQGTEDLDEGRTISAIEILHHKVQVVFTGKGPVEFGDEIALSLPHHNGALRLDVGNLVLGDHVSFLQYLDSVVVSG